MLFGTLKNADRLELLRYLIQVQSATVDQLGRRFPALHQPTISKHMIDLAGQGLVAREGNIQAPYGIPRAREVRTLLRAAAVIQAVHHGAAAGEAKALADEMLSGEAILGAGGNEDETRPPAENGSRSGIT